MGTPEANLRTDVDLLEKLLHQEHDACVSSIRRAFEKGNTDAFGQSMHEVEKTIHSATKALSRLLLVGNQITTFAEEFAHGISGFGDFGRIDIVRILHETVALVSNSLLAKSDADIRIHIKGEKKADVFCSPLIKQHLFCLLHNAILSIQERLSQTSEPPGVVNIDVSLDSPKESTKEVQLNKMWLVKIHDNGRGVTPEQLEDLRQFRPGTRFRSSRGQGYALPAAQRYLASVGGRIWINSEEGKFFEVFLMFDPFRSDVHESLVVHRS